MEETPRDNAVPVPPADSDLPPSALPWGKIAAVVLLVLVIIAGIAVVVRPQNHAPTIKSATASAPSAAVGDSLTFTAQATDPDSDALAYQWDFGDGTTATGVEIKHAYTLPGQFIALLTVSDGKGGQVTNDQNLISVRINPKASDLTVTPCVTATCKPGPVVAVLSADHATAVVGATIAFNGNASWAYEFSWVNGSNHSSGGSYAVVVAANNTSLFALFRYVWGDSTDNTTGTSDAVGRTVHVFAAPGNYFVRLMVLYVRADLNPSQKAAFAGYTVRVTSAVSTYAVALGPFGALDAQRAYAGVLPVAQAIRFD